MFATNLGDYLFTQVPVEFTCELGSYATRAFFGLPDGSFADPGVGELGATFFGWGTVTLDNDNDNDNDTDVVYHGGQDISVIEATPPGLVLDNTGDGTFRYDWQALAHSTDHARRSVQGVASGDLNNDGFVDIVSVSNHDFPPEFSLVNYPKQWGFDTDARARFFPAFLPGENPGEFKWSGLEPVDGTLSVEMHSADNGNHWVVLELKGSVGLTTRGKANRDAFGAVVTFTPDAGKPAMRPILGGASYVSQDSLKAYFGLGRARRGTVDILWPGGTRNRFYYVHASESLVLPEIPCSFDQGWKNFNSYRDCVQTSLEQLDEQAGIFAPGIKQRLLASAIRAYWEALRQRR